MSKWQSRIFGFSFLSVALAMAVCVLTPNAWSQMDPEKMKEKRKEIELEHEVSMEFETPHTNWAQPYAGGRIRLLYIFRATSKELSVSGAGMSFRPVIELAQRFDLAVDVVMQDWGGELGNERLLGLLAKPYDVYLIRGRSSDSYLWASLNTLPEEAREKIFEHVQLGAGLVLIGPGEQDYTFPAAARLPGLPVFVKADEVHALGKGRAVLLSQSPSFYEYRRGLDVEVDHWQQQIGRAMLWAAGREPKMSLHISIEAGTNVIDRSKLPAQQLSVSWDNAPEGVRLEIVLRRSDGWRESLDTVSCDGAKGRRKLMLPVVRAGDYYLNVRALSKRGVETWDAARFTITSTREVKEVAIEKDWSEVGGEITGQVELIGQAIPGESLRVQLVDRRGRVLMRQDIASTAGRPSFRFPVRKWLPMLVEVEAAVMQDGKEVAAAFRHFYVTKRHTDKFNILMWSYPHLNAPYSSVAMAQYGMKSMARRGITIMLGSNSRNPTVAAFEMATVPTAVWLGGDFASLAESLDDNGIMTWSAIRDKDEKKIPVCYNDLEKVDAFIDTIMEKCRSVRQQGVFLYSLGDEEAVRGACLSPHCLTAYRNYLREQYGNIRALNASWGENHKGFDEVQLSPKQDLPAATASKWFKEYYAKRVENLKKLTKISNEKIRNADVNAEIAALQSGNFSRWYDRQAFMCYNLVKLSKRIETGLREIDPQARLTLEGTNSFTIPRFPRRVRRGGDVDLIMREFNAFVPYMWDPIDELMRSIARPGFTWGHWMGYKKSPELLLNRYWRMITHGAPLVMWWRWEGIGKYHGFLAPHLGAYPAGRELLEDTQITRDGLGDLLMQYRMQDDGVAMLYSFPSTYAVHLEDQLGMGGFRRSHDAWHHAIRDTGLSFRYVTDRMLKRAEVSLDAFKVLILSRSPAISEKEASMIREFVRSGGMVIADTLPAVYDDHCKPRAQGALNDLFGVERAGKSSTTQRTVTFDGVVGDTVLNSRVPGVTVDSSIRVGTGVALASAGPDTPACIVNDFGKGRAVLLNFSLRHYAGSGSGLVKLLLQDVGVRPQITINPGGIEVVRWRNGQTELFSLWGDYNGDVTVSLPDGRYVYDLRRGRSLGLARDFTVMLNPWRATYFALLPKEAPTARIALEPTAVEPGQTATAIISVPQSTGKRALRLRVTMADGRPAEWSNTNVVIGSDPVRLPIPVAYTDPPGEWKIRVIDLFTNEAATIALTVE